MFRIVAKLLSQMADSFGGNGGSRRKKKEGSDCIFHTAPLRGGRQHIFLSA